MEYLLKKYNYLNSFLLLIFLNLFDGIATYIGLSSMFYIEKNKIISVVYEQNQGIYIIIKLLVPTIVLYLLMKKIGNDISNIVKTMLCLANIVYISICIYHIVLYITVISASIIENSVMDSYILLLY